MVGEWDIMGFAFWSTFITWLGKIHHIKEWDNSLVWLGQFSRAMLNYQRVPVLSEQWINSPNSNEKSNQHSHWQMISNGFFWRAKKGSYIVCAQSYNQTWHVFFLETMWKSGDSSRWFTSKEVMWIDSISCRGSNWEAAVSQKPSTCIYVSSGNN